MQSLTPVLIVDNVEPAAAFWRDRLGFTQTMEVQHEGTLGFVGLSKGAVNIMYQSRASVAADIPALANGPYRAALFIVVEDLGDVERAMQGAEVVSPRRSTFYGMDEITVREPGGNVITFAQPTPGASQ